MNDTAESYFDNFIGLMKAQFGDAIESVWFYDGDLCPCCLTRQIDAMDYHGERALSVNGFMYREYGVLIGYFLCPKCAEWIMAESKNGPTPLHKIIETNLSSAYRRHMSSSRAH